MSIKLMQLVWEQDIPQGPKMLLLCLADYSNDDGESYPGTDTICARCSFSQASLYRHLGSLEEDDFLARHQMGDRTLYVLNVEKIRQLPLLANSQNESGRKLRGLSLREVHPRKVRGGTSQIESPIKQPPANHQEPPRGGHGNQMQDLDERELSVVSCYSGIPSGLDLKLFVMFVDYCAEKRKAITISVWKLLIPKLNAMAAAGHDLNEVIKTTMLRRLVDPVAPDKQKTATPRANDDLSGTVYEPNDVSKLPEHLRPGAAVGG